MNVPDLRHVDFDAYRQRARELHLEAIELSIDRLVARMETEPESPANRMTIPPAEVAVACFRRATPAPAMDGALRRPGPRWSRTSRTRGAR